jgi:hypothetical protein
MGASPVSRLAVEGVPKWAFCTHESVVAEVAGLLLSDSSGFVAGGLGTRAACAVARIVDGVMPANGCRAVMR